ncbi:MAG: diguanylate cyclase [Oscillospiraceae bacterium]
MNNSFLMVVNIFSTLIYVAMLFFLYRRKFILVIFATYLEISLHSTIATLLLGWEYGFPLLLIALVPLAFYCPFKKRVTAFFYSGFSILNFISLRCYTFSYPPKIAAEFDASHFFYIFNTAVAILALVLFSCLYNFMIRDYQQMLTTTNASLRVLADTDPLTGLLNRRSMVTKIDEVYGKKVEKKETYSVAISDIDDFKAVNDKYGHDCGDYILKQISEIFQAELPKDVSICRWGGEEFLFILPNCNVAEAKIKCENLCKAIREYPYSYYNDKMKITMTFGVCDSEKANMSDMVLNADKNLYIGKRNGKNQVVC